MVTYIYRKAQSPSTVALTVLVKYSLSRTGTRRSSSKNRSVRSEKVMETAVGDAKVGRFFLHQPLRLSDVICERTPHMSVSVADLCIS